MKDSEKQLTYKEKCEAYKKGIDDMLRRSAERRKHWTPEQLAAEEERQRYWEHIEEAEKKYLATGLGEPIPQCYLDDAPPEVMDYPGGIVGVYEEAMRRGIPWEKVCGYKPLDPLWFKHAFLD